MNASFLTSSLPPQRYVAPEPPSSERPLPKKRPLSSLMSTSPDISGPDDTRKLCAVCQNVLSGSRPRHDWMDSGLSDAPAFSYDHHATEIDLLEAANSGCYLCILVRDGICYLADIWLQTTKQHAASIIPSQLSIVESFGQRALQLSYPFAPDIETRPKTRWSDEFYAWRIDLAEVEAVQKYLGEGILEGWTSSDASIALVKIWMHRCATGHELCNFTYDLSKPWYPTRLLVLGERASFKDVSLLITKENPPIGPYAALSHCWGSGLQLSQLRLLSANLDAWCKSIDVSSLPTTFLDAIKLTRDIGLKYLWIDALCIIQNSRSDWARESADMGNVYRHSWCNFAAAAATNGSQGCFRLRSDKISHRQQLNFTWGEKYSGKFVLSPKDIWPEHVQRAPLHNRGWVLQERVLSPRTVHFGDILSWECRQLEACEIYPHGLPPLTDHDEEVYGRNCKSQAARDLLDHSQSYSTEPGRVSRVVDRYWHRVVSMFTETKLTYEEDYLVALSGIAQQVKSTINSDYLAGLWRAKLATQLVWAALDPVRSSRPTVYRAPSWSWASISGPVLPGRVENYTRKIEPLLGGARHETITIPDHLDAKVTLAGYDLTGQVVDGKLSVQTVLMRRELHRQEGDVFVVSRLAGEVSETKIWPDCVTELYRQELFFVPLIVSADSLSNSFILGLAVVRCGDQVSTYRRVGLFYYNAHGHWPSLEKRWKGKPGDGDSGDPEFEVVKMTII